jgi:acyl-CoA reductase-like NAD-dependent aldehyde dehydrogenase
MAIAQDEIFGPIAPIIKVKDEEEALHVANQTEYGLSSAVFTRDNVACGSPALRSSEVDLQHRESLQLPIREIQFRSQ